MVEGGDNKKGHAYIYRVENRINRGAGRREDVRGVRGSYCLRTIFPKLLHNLRDCAAALPGVGQVRPLFQAN